MTYELGTHIDSEPMLVKNDREMDARDSMRNAEDDKHRQLIGRGTLLGPAAPRRRRLLRGVSMSHPSSRGPDILLKVYWHTDCTWTLHLCLVMY
jgi:hypothetical protein